MRKIAVGIVLPLFAIVMTFRYRLAWNYDIHPPQLEWWVWASSLVLTGAALGFGTAMYWTKGGHRQDTRKRGKDRHHDDD